MVLEAVFLSAVIWADEQQNHTLHKKDSQNSSEIYR